MSEPFKSIYELELEARILADQTNDDQDIAAINASLADITQLQIEDIVGTTQAMTFNPDGTVASITHTDADSNVIRTDTFTYTATTITELRTLTSGGTQTIVFHTDTYETEVS